MLSAEQLYNLGLSNERNGSIDRALHYYSAMIVSWPNEIAPYHRLSVIALQRGDPSLALAWTDKGIAVDDKILEIWNNRALALAQLNRFDEAKEAFERAIAIREDNWEAHYNLGRMLFVEQRFQDAEPILRRATELDPYSAQTWNNLGLVLHELYRYDEAIAAFDRALELVPDYIEAISNKGSSFYYAQKLDAAEAEFRRALELAPMSGGIHYSLGSVLLSGGNAREGFREHDWRWKAGNRSKLRNYPQPVWNGERLIGQTILVWPEQGLGDTIQFLRFIPDLAKLECDILLELPPELHRLATASFSLTNVRIVHSGSQQTNFDLHVPLMNLARLLDFEYESIKPFKPYLRARGNEVDEWRRKIKTMTPPEHRKKKRIGIAWAGSPMHTMDRNRSITWETFRPIVEQNKKKFQFFSLQPGKAPDDPDVIDLGESLRDFAATAAIVMNLDHIITVDTSLLHLAGAMGKRTWGLYFHLPDWRWKLGEERSAWYPSLLRFTQQIAGNWDKVIAEVNETLALE